MTSEREQQKLDWMRNLRCAWQAWDAYTGDVNGRTDIMRRIRQVEEHLRELGVGKAEFAAYCLQEDERERAARKIRAIAAYERTGIISQ